MISVEPNAISLFIKYVNSRNAYCQMPLAFTVRDQVSVVTSKDVKSIGVQAVLVAESESAQSEYKSSWELRASRNQLVSAAQVISLMK